MQLGAEGYRVTARERRECSRAGCPTDVLVDWNHTADVPAGWYTSTVCGKHNFKTCPGCASVYQMASTNSVGQAASVACQVCGTLLVSWGGSKNWSAVLVESPGAAPAKE
jgi:hypothetical protein